MGPCISIAATPVECGRQGGAVNSLAQQFWRRTFGERMADYRAMRGGMSDDERNANYERLRQNWLKWWQDHREEWAEIARRNGAKGGRPSLTDIRQRTGEDVDPPLPMSPPKRVWE